MPKTAGEVYLPCATSCSSHRAIMNNRIYLGKHSMTQTLARRGLPFYRQWYRTGGPHVFVLNPKCIVFGIVLIALYLAGVVVGGTLHTRRDLTVSAVIWLIGYVALAEYDLAYECAHGSMVKGDGLTSMLKSGGNKAMRKRCTTNQIVIYASHLLIAAILIFGSGLIDIPSKYINGLRITQVIAAVLAVFYHSYQLYNCWTGGRVVYDGKAKAAVSRPRSTLGG